MSKQKVLPMSPQWEFRGSIADNGTIDVPNTRSNGGRGIAQMGDGEEYAEFSFTSAGVVTLITNSANVTNTGGSAGKFNIFTGGALIRFENKLASGVKNLMIIIWFG